MTPVILIFGYRIRSQTVLAFTGKDAILMEHFTDAAWRAVETYPRHFHDGSQDAVESAPFSPDLIEGFRDFLRFAAGKLMGGEADTETSK